MKCNVAAAILLLGAISTSSLNCAKHDTGRLAEPEIQTAEAQIGEHFDLVWHTIDLPIDGDKLLSGQKGLYILSSEGIALLEKENGNNVILLPPYKIVKRYISDSGGVTKKLLPLENKNKNGEGDQLELCNPETARFFSDDLYVLSICEHTPQLWKVILGRNSTLLEVTGFTGGDKEKDNEISGPSRLPSKNTQKVLIASFLNNGAALLSKNKSNDNFEVIWEAKKDEGGIVGLDVVENEGWLLLSSGKIMHSMNSGNTWEYFGSISQEIEPTGIIFRNKLEGYIIGSKGQVLETVNGGVEWETQKAIVDDFLYKIVVSDKWAVILGENEIICNKKGENIWRKITEFSENNIDDFLFYDNKLFLLQGKKLFVADLP